MSWREWTVAGISIGVPALWAVLFGNQSIGELATSAVILVVIPLIVIGIATVVLGRQETDDSKRCDYCGKWVPKTSVFCPLCHWPNHPWVDDT
jgi:hypothetical protein